MTIATTDPRTVEALEADIRASAGRRDPVKTRLGTSERIIARVTDGIYREPWAAFRELVANAYDADATYVTIETSQPEFRRITVKDNGNGMSPKTLAYVLKNIGGSSKRTSSGADLNTVDAEAHDRSPEGRQLIGKIGIGLFAVAQLTQHFQIITKASGEAERLSATVRLQTHDEEEARRDDYVAGEVVIVSERAPDNEIESQGTEVVLYDLREEVRRTLQSVRRWEAVRVETVGGETMRKPPDFHIGCSLEKFCKDPNLPWDAVDPPKKKFDLLFEASGSASKATSQLANLEHFDEYLRLIWKLSLSLPLDYIGEHPFKLDGSSGLLFFGIPDATGQAQEIDLANTESVGEHMGLRAGQQEATPSFSVTFDGIALRRPVRLRRELLKESRVGVPVVLAAKQENPFSNETLRRAGGPLSFEGYLYWNSKIVPKETAGVLIRIREASGTLFDQTFLNYQVSEQTRLRQITAEIFVHEGLDSAVNIDRESFNYSHPHFLYIQRWLHRALRLLVNRLKTLAAEDLARSRSELREAALLYADGIWSRRLGIDADPPLADFSVNNLPNAVGDADLKWPDSEIRTYAGKIVGTGKIGALAVILEAYGLLSTLPIEDRSRVIEDILGIPEINS